MKRLRLKGFTIVELLIVIAVIAILAAIVGIVYTNVQRNARNTKTIAEASQMVELFATYRVTFNKNPADTTNVGGSGGYCLTVDNVCSDFQANPPLNTNNSNLIAELRKVGSVLEKGPPKVGNNGRYFGLYLDYNEARFVNGKNLPYLIMYRLEGKDQPCKLKNIVVDKGFYDGGAAGSQDVPQSPPYTYLPYVYNDRDNWSYSGYEGENITECWVSIE